MERKMTLLLRIRETAQISGIHNEDGGLCHSQDMSKIKMTRGRQRASYVKGLSELKTERSEGWQRDKTLLRATTDGKLRRTMSRMS